MDIQLLNLREKGFHFSDEDVILLFIGGSQLHGAKLEGSDDTDYYGVFVEPPEYMLGMDSYEHFVWSSAISGDKNQARDVDITLYSLRKWARLAAKGNPTVLQFLFAPPLLHSNVWDHFVARNRDTFLCRNHLNAFLGYGKAQLERLQGFRGQKNVNRAELVSAHGYDTKYAMHAVRLMDEGLELMQTGKISCPRPNKEYLMSVRRGEIPLAAVVAEIDSLKAAALSTRPQAPLPDQVDRKAISEQLRMAYLAHWSMVVL